MLDVLNIVKVDREGDSQKRAHSSGNIPLVILWRNTCFGTFAIIFLLFFLLSSYMCIALLNSDLWD